MSALPTPDCRREHMFPARPTTRLSASTRSSVTQRPLPSSRGTNSSPPPYSLDGYTTRHPLPPLQVKDTPRGGSEITAHPQESLPAPPLIPYNTRPVSSLRSAPDSDNQVSPSSLCSSLPQTTSQRTPTPPEPDLIPIPHAPDLQVVPLVPLSVLCESGRGTKSQQGLALTPHAPSTVTPVPPLRGDHRSSPDTVLSQPPERTLRRIRLTEKLSTPTPAAQSSDGSTTKASSRAFHATSTTRHKKYGGMPLQLPALPLVYGHRDNIPAHQSAAPSAPRSYETSTIELSTSRRRIVVSPATVNSPRIHASRNGPSVVPPPTTDRPWYRIVC